MGHAGRGAQSEARWRDQCQEACQAGALKRDKEGEEPARGKLGWGQWQTQAPPADQGESKICSTSYMSHTVLDFLKHFFSVS